MIRIMKTFTLATVAAIALGSVSAHAGARTAELACEEANPYQPARAIRRSPDGAGDYDVLVEDTDGDLWNCNASGEGYIYWNRMR